MEMDEALLRAYARVHAFYQLTRWVSPPCPWLAMATHTQTMASWSNLQP